MLEVLLLDWLQKEVLGRTGDPPPVFKKRESLQGFSLKTFQTSNPKSQQQVDLTMHFCHLFRSAQIEAIGLNHTD